MTAQGLISEYGIRYRHQFYLVLFDVHSGNVARKLGLLDRKQNDAKALKILDTSLRQMDPIDPVKYDFALFGLGVFENFS